MTNKVIESARSLIGTKWRHKGRSNRAIDCVGILVYSFREAGVELIDRKHYGRHPWQDGLDAELEKNFGERLDKKNMKAGDIAVIWFDNFPAPSHVGIIADHPSGKFSLIHSHSLISVTEHIIDEIWYNKITHIYRYEKW